MDSRSSGRATGFGFALALAATSGAAALMHELLWTRRLVDLLGASSDSETRVLGCFFVGMALGAALAERLWPHFDRPWLALAAVELGIAIAVLPSIALPLWTDWLWPALGPERLVDWWGGAAKLAASLLVILPPALLIGMTLPLMGKAALVGERRLGRHGTWLYAVNTAGGVIGLALATMWLVPALGVVRSMCVALVLNLVVAAGAYAASRREARREADETSSTIPIPGRILAIAAFSGAGVLALEVVALGLLRQVVPSSLHGMNAVLMATLLVLAAAAALVGFLTRTWSARLMLPVIFLATALVTVAVPELFVGATDGLQPLDSSPSLPVFVLQVVGLALVTLGPALFFAGLVLPATFEWLASDHGDLHGRRWGIVLAANGIGGVLGAELAHRAVIPAFGFYGAAAIIAAAYAVGAMALALKAGKDRKRRAAVGAASLIALALVVVLMPARLDKLPDIWEELEYRVLSKATGREGLVTVVEHAVRGRGIALNNAYFLGGTGAVYEERRQAHLPLLLHREPREVLFIGLATGLTAVAALEHRSVETVSAVELSELVVRASREHFADVSGAVHTSPRASVVVEDGRTFVAAARDRYDVVVGDLFLPWRAGVGRLYTVEHFEAVREALRPGGLFAQWLPAHQLSRQQLDAVLATLTRVFPRAFLFRGSFSLATMPLLILAPRDDDPLAWEDLERRCRALAGAGVRDPLMRHAEGIGMLYLGPVGPQRLGDAPVNTLGNAWLEIDAGRTRVSGMRSEQYLAHDRWLAAEADLASPGEAGSIAGLELEALAARGRAIMTVPRNRWLDAAEKARFRTEVLEGFPEAMLRDQGADWAASRVLGQLLTAGRRPTRSRSPS